MPYTWDIYNADEIVNLATEYPNIATGETNKIFVINNSQNLGSDINTVNAKTNTILITNGGTLNLTNNVYMAANIKVLQGGKINYGSYTLYLLASFEGHHTSSIFSGTGKVDMSSCDVNGLITPNMFGAKGDDTTDDTLATQTTINTGKKVTLLEDSKYIIKDKLTLNTTSQEIVGLNATTSIIKFSPTTGTNNIGFQTKIMADGGMDYEERLKYVQMKNFLIQCGTFDGTTPRVDKLLDLRCASEWLIERVYFQRGKTLIHLGSDTESDNCIQDIIFNADGTAGTFTLSIGADTSNTINYDDNASEIETAIEAMTTVTSVTVTFNTGATQAGDKEGFKVEFDGADAETDFDPFTADVSSLTGVTSATITKLDNIVSYNNIFNDCFLNGDIISYSNNYGIYSGKNGNRNVFKNTQVGGCNYPIYIGKGYIYADILDLEFSDGPLLINSSNSSITNIRIDSINTEDVGGYGGQDIILTENSSNNKIDYKPAFTFGNFYFRQGRQAIYDAGSSNIILPELGFGNPETQNLIPSRLYKGTGSNNITVTEVNDPIFYQYASYDVLYTANSVVEYLESETFTLPSDWEGEELSFGCMVKGIIDTPPLALISLQNCAITGQPYYASLNSNYKTTGKWTYLWTTIKLTSEHADVTTKILIYPGRGISGYTHDNNGVKVRVAFPFIRRGRGFIKTV